ncbi:MAG: amidohydrolase [Crocinitomix sp.]|nr:amidohydrolase [Crocinitomix sp.]
MQDLKMGLIQTQQFWEDKAANLAHYEAQFLSKIKPNTVDLILLPEMFNTSFSMKASQFAEEMNGASIEWLMRWAKNLNCQIGGSLIISEEGHYYNRFVIVSQDGIESTYDKRHLFRMVDEHQHFSPGQNRVIHVIKGWPILLQVCYDLRFPVFSRNRFLKDEKEYAAVIYVANWPKKRAFIWKNLIQARAIENQTYSVGLNRVGKDGNGFTYSGDSMLVDPWGNIETSFPANKEHFQIVTLKKSVMDDIKTNFPAYLDADN